MTAGHSHFISIADGVPSALAVQIYTEGDCWILAFELGLLLDRPIVAVGPSPFPEWWDHVLVDLEDGRLLDVYGPHRESECLARWSRPSDADPVGFTHLGLHDEWSAYCDVLGTSVFLANGEDQRAARRIAQELVDQHGLSRKKVHAWL